MPAESDVIELLDLAWAQFAIGWGFVRDAHAIMENPTLKGQARIVERLMREAERAIIRVVDAWDRIPEGKAIRERAEGEWTCACGTTQPLTSDGRRVCRKCGHEPREEGPDA